MYFHFIKHVQCSYFEEEEEEETVLCNVVDRSIHLFVFTQKSDAEILSLPFLFIIYLVSHQHSLKK